MLEPAQTLQKGCTFALRARVQVGLLRQIAEYPLCLTAAISCCCSECALRRWRHGRRPARQAARCTAPAAHRRTSCGLRPGRLCRNTPTPPRCALLAVSSLLQRSNCKVALVPQQPGGQAVYRSRPYCAEPHGCIKAAILSRAEQLCVSASTVHMPLGASQVSCEQSFKAICHGFAEVHVGHAL